MARSAASPGVRLRRSDALGRVQNLPLQVGQIDRVAVDQTIDADAGRCEVEGGGRPQPTGAYDEHARRPNLLLAFDADLVQQNMARVAQQLAIVQMSDRS